MSDTKEILIEARKVIKKVMYAWAYSPEPKFSYDICLSAADCLTKLDALIKKQADYTGCPDCCEPVCPNCNDARFIVVTTIEKRMVPCEVCNDQNPL
jgi:hypothetical protein